MEETQMEDNNNVTTETLLYKLFKKHAGHTVEIVNYGDGVNFSLEDIDTDEVIFDTDCYDLVGLD